eukprot:scaffold6164_cov163-Amphora_coffeaeformis.AAC.8
MSICLVTYNTSVLSNLIMQKRGKTNNNGQFQQRRLSSLLPNANNNIMEYEPCDIACTGANNQSTVLRYRQFPQQHNPVHFTGDQKRYAMVNVVR